MNVPGHDNFLGFEDPWGRVGKGAVSEDTDEAVFSILNLDHDRFLLELDFSRNETYEPMDGQHNLKSAWIKDDICGPPATPAPYVEIPLSVRQEHPDKPQSPTPHEKRQTKPEIHPQETCGGNGKATEAFSSDKHQRSSFAKNREQFLKALTEDIANGKTCNLLRANINGLRTRGMQLDRDGHIEGQKRRCPSPTHITRGRAESRAAEVLQSAWRGFVFRHVFLHLREIIREHSRFSPRAALQVVNPREAGLADAASDIIVRFRLAADLRSTLPVVVYKVFTRRPVIDVCRGYYPCSTLFPPYRRVENNDWRVCGVGLLFDAERCSARGRRWVWPWRGYVRKTKHSAPGNKKTDPHDKERQAKIAKLRGIYGFETNPGKPQPPPQNDAPCPSPCSTRPTTTATARTEVKPDDTGAPKPPLTLVTVMDDGDAGGSDLPPPLPVVPEVPATPDSSGDTHSEYLGVGVPNKSTPQDPGRVVRRSVRPSNFGDGYYSRLMSTWGA